MATQSLPLEVHSYQERLGALFDKVKQFPTDDLQLLAHWAAYLCVLASGLIEVALRSILMEHASSASSPNVTRYVDHQLGRMQNPNMEVILQVVRSFNEDWAREIDDATAGEIAASVNSVIANRHRIAHGRSVDLTLGQMRTYFRDTVRMLEIVQRTCNP